MLTATSIQLAILFCIACAAIYGFRGWEDTGLRGAIFNACVGFVVSGMAVVFAYLIGLSWSANFA